MFLMKAEIKAYKEEEMKGRKIWLIIGYTKESKKIPSST